MAHAALAAIQLALERAPPILALIRARGAAGNIELSGPEDFAQISVSVADELTERPHDYAAALEGNLDYDDLLPFESRSANRGLRSAQLSPRISHSARSAVSLS